MSLVPPDFLVIDQVLEHDVAVLKPDHQQQAVAVDRERTDAAAHLQGGPALLEAAPALDCAVDRA